MTNLKAAAMAAGFVALLAFQSHQSKKTYKVEAPIEYWISATNGLEFTKNYLKSSNLPAKDVTLMCDSILIPMREEMARQVQAQIDTERRKDTIKPKK